MKRDFNWCATKTDKTGQMSHWGLCDSDSEIPDCPNEDSKDLGIYYNIYNDNILRYEFNQFYFMKNAFFFFNILISRIFFSM